MPETLEKTSFGSAVPDKVNVERALRADERFSGHFVQGHVDATGRVKAIDTNDGYRISFEFASDFADYIIPKGSITIDGVSLTVVDATADSLSVALIPFTLEHTTLDSLHEGSVVNLEFDMIGKYVAALMNRRKDAAR
jgi:riboflavin synthase